MNSKTFSGIISGWMKNSSVSLRSLAGKCELDSSYLSKILKGKRSPPSDEKTIRKIAEVIGADPDYLTFACGRIPSKLQKLFLRSDIKEILERLAQAEKITAEVSRETPRNIPREQPVYPVRNKISNVAHRRKRYIKTEIPDEIL